MKNIKIFFALIFFLIISSGIKAQNSVEQLNLLPVPFKISLEEGKFRLDTNFTISIHGNPDQRIYSAASRFLRRLSNRTGIFFSQDFISKADNSDTSQFKISCHHPGKVKLHENESYKLIINQNKIELTSVTDIGSIYGLETLLQLLQIDSAGYYFPLINIDDKPRFAWRGLMIDVCRHFMPLKVIKRNLDAMAAVKMNVLHLHLSDDQGFRIESKIFPELTKLGSDGKFFTKNQIKEIIKYAGERGIRVIPEFDVPGHATSWFASHPELASLPADTVDASHPYKVARTWGILDAVFNPAIEETYEFLDKFFGEMAQLFTDEYFHIGGDENNGKQWDANESIQKFMKENNIADNHELQTYFNKRILKILTKHKKKMIGWDEILQPDMPNNIVIQSWRGTDALIKAAKKGYMGILSNGYYIDLIQPAKFHYLNDPIPENSPLTEEQKKNILGGEATMWSELVTPETIDSRIWPRTAAIAERFWSPQNIKDVNDMYRRLETVSFHLEELGLTHIKNYEMMLRRLTNNENIIFLKTFVDIIEPVKIYTRHRQGVKYTSFSPYTRTVDAARPESKTAREFSNLVDNYLSGQKENYSRIENWLTLWRDNFPNLKTTLESSPILKEMIPMSENLLQISLAGLDTLDHLKNNKSADEEWLNEKLELIKKSKKPYGQTELMVVEPIEKLIKAVRIK